MSYLKKFLKAERKYKKVKSDYNQIVDYICGWVKAQYELYYPYNKVKSIKFIRMNDYFAVFDVNLSVSGMPKKAKFKVNSGNICTPEFKFEDLQFMFR